MKIKIVFIILFLITVILCSKDDCVESSFTQTELTLDSIATCLPGSKIKNMQSLSSVNLEDSCTFTGELRWFQFINITLNDGSKTSILIENQPLKVTRLNGNGIAILNGNATINNKLVHIYLKSIIVNNDEDACCSSAGLTYKESIYFYFGVFGKQFRSTCLGSMRFYFNPGVH